ncbi:MAG: phytanoyl-CoA dioxygenase family protein [Candidatus Poribacteria bacterium]|nr:phytanoyl-CoA dioxygenase family protein [Candidatus Poribacteria bacterium]
MLTPEKKRFYDENGFILKKGLVPFEDIQQIREEIKDIHNRMAEHPVDGIGLSWEEFDNPNLPPRIKQLMHSELISPALNRILRSDAMLDIIEKLIGPDISLYHSKLLPKDAEDGTAIPWHQDYAYWNRDDNRPLMVNCQLAIDPTTRENGCIQFVPGSHKWGLQEHERRQQTFGVFLKGHYCERDDAVAVEMAPGDGVFFNALVIHGSAANTSNLPRQMNTFAFNVTGNGITQCREALRGKPLGQ